MLYSNPPPAIKRDYLKHPGILIIFAFSAIRKADIPYHLGFARILQAKYYLRLKSMLQAMGKRGRFILAAGGEIVSSEKEDWFWQMEQ